MKNYHSSLCNKVNISSFFFFIFVMTIWSIYSVAQTDAHRRLNINKYTEAARRLQRVPASGGKRKSKRTKKRKRGGDRHHPGTGYITSAGQTRKNNSSKMNSDKNTKNQVTGYKRKRKSTRKQSMKKTKTKRKHYRGGMR